MKKGVLVCLIVGASLVLLGILLFVGVMSVMKWDFRKLSTEKYETSTTEIGDPIETVSIETITSDVAFLPSEDGKCRVVCYEQSKVKHAVTVSEGVLTVKVEDTRKWYDHISAFSFGHPTVTVYLPRGEYGALSVKLSTGDMEIPAEFFFETVDISGTTGDVSFSASVKGSMKVKTTTGGISVKNIVAGSVDLLVSTGRVEVSSVRCAGDLTVGVSTGKARLADVSCKNLYSTGDTGDLHLTRVIAKENFSIERETGDVTLERCDASELCIRTDTGDVEGSLLTEKIFLAKSDTGRVEVPQSVSGGRCEITTDTGDIEITVG